MKIYRMAVANHAFLQEMTAFLDAQVPPLTFPVRPDTSNGDYRADIEAGPPDVDRDKPLTFKRVRLQAPITMRSFPGATLVSGLNYYPVGGAGIGWHTDSHAPGWRVYLARPLTSLPGITYAFESVPGRDRPQLLTHNDVPGLALAFYISGRAQDSWHAIHAPGPRFSMGVRIRSRRVARALGLPVDTGEGP